MVHVRVIYVQRAKARNENLDNNKKKKMTKNVSQNHKKSIIISYLWEWQHSRRIVEPDKLLHHSVSLSVQQAEGNWEENMYVVHVHNSDNTKVYVLVIS